MTSRRSIALLATFLAACAPAGDPPAEQTSETDAPATAQAPPGTDVWLAEIVRDEAGRVVGITDPANVTGRDGYDNQPYFLPDGSGFWYTTIDEVGQADIRFYDLEAAASRAVTSTAPESEYSATPLESGPGFSAIRVEADSTQRLWRFGPDGSGAAVVFEDVAPVGYHAWADAATVVMFVLGDPPTLQLGDVPSGRAEVVARDIGRSLQRIPGTRNVSYVQWLGESATEIRRLDVATGESVRLIEGVEGSDFHAWTPDGTLLQANGGRLFAWEANGGEGWREIADLGGLGLELSRIAVHPDGVRIALVAEVVPG